MCTHGVPAQITSRSQGHSRAAAPQSRARLSLRPVFPGGSLTPTPAGRWQRPKPSPFGEIRTLHLVHAAPSAPNAGHLCPVPRKLRAQVGQLLGRRALGTGDRGGPAGCRGGAGLGGGAWGLPLCPGCSFGLSADLRNIYMAFYQCWGQRQTWSGTQERGRNPSVLHRLKGCLPLGI